MLDYHRIPYDVELEPREARLEGVREAHSGRALLWPARLDTKVVAVRLLAPAIDGGIPIFARVLPDSEVGRLLGGRGWERVLSIADALGRRWGSVWRRDDGSIFLPFDPDEVVRNYWTEGYSLVPAPALSRSIGRSVVGAYYRVRPLLPRTAQIWLRRRIVRLQQRVPFPNWPTETALDDFFEFLFTNLSQIAGARIPRIAAWPQGRKWSLVLTHDVEQAQGYAAIDPVLELERPYGLRSCWNLVPRRYRVQIEDVRRLTDEGSEVGVHGLYHDGRDLSSLTQVRKRLPAIREAAERWGAVGFRSPALHRNWDWMPLLGFDYDSSFPDTDPYEPMPGGCCSSLPFFIGNLVELPVTLPQDHTLFVILQHRDETVWVHKTEQLRQRGAMALINTHPDYLVDRRIRDAYDRFLGRFAQDPDVWNALPREVSAWWRRRAASQLEHDGSGWHIVGPAAMEGRVEFVGRAS